MDYLNDIFNQLLALKAEGLVAILCLIVGYLCRWLRFIRNRYIPVICVAVGAFVYPLLVPITAIASDGPKYPAVRRVIIGIIIGFGIWVFHKALIKPLEARFPGIGNFLDGTGDGNSDPVAFTKPQSSPTPTPTDPTKTP